MPAFSSNKIAFFFPKKYLYSKKECESSDRDLLVLFSVFVRRKVTITENVTFGDSVFGIRPPDCSKLAKNPKNNNDAPISRHDINDKIFLTVKISRPPQKPSNILNVQSQK